MSPPPNSAAAFLQQQGLHRQASLPSRTPGENPPPPPEMHDPALGRSKSWKPVVEDDEWRQRAGVVRGATTASEHRAYQYRQSQQQPQPQQQGHYRSPSNTSQNAPMYEHTSPVDPTFPLSVGYPRSGLHKSASLRSNTSQTSNAPSHGHQGGYARTVLTRGRMSPSSGASLNWDHLASPTFAKSEDNHAIQTTAREAATVPRGIQGPIIGIGQGVGSPTYPPPVTMQRTQLDTDGQGADVRRHQSLQQGFGHSTKVRERLARSQALLPPDQRTPITTAATDTPVETRERERRTSDLARNVWSLNGAGGTDGWAQVDVAMRARANATPVHAGRRETPPAQQGVDQAYQDLMGDTYHREGLMHAFQAMQLGHPGEMPPGIGATGPVSTPSPLGDVYRANYAYAPPVGAAYENPGEYAGYGARPEGLEYSGYAHGVTAGYPAFQTAPVSSVSMPHVAPNVPYAPPQPHPHAHNHPPPVVPDHIARAAEYEVHQMIAKRQLNPVDFVCEPENARFFVIKSFTEDDVHKSLKHEIWSSTTYGNQRLDKAFAEARGPVYLFFSVNGSGHFCGVAQMLSAVDYNQTSTVWAQDKWKGIFKLRWIFVKDIPNGALRHIRLMNTQEQKPITNSRDTQELLWDAGCEVLAIFSKFREKTSLLQDWGFHEMQALERAQRQQHTPSAMHPGVFPDAQEMPPVPNHGEGGNHTRDTDNGQEPHRGPAKQGGLVKGFSATGPPSLTGQNQGFSVVSRGSKAVTKIF